MDIHPIRTEADHKAALRELSGYFNNEPAPGTEEDERFEVLLTLVEAYETEHYPIGLPDPIEAIKFHMEQCGLAPKDLAPAIGRLNRVYEVLNRKRPLTLPMIWNLHRMFGIPASSLISPPEERKAA